jgi:outer membrane protein W
MKISKVGMMLAGLAIVGTNAVAQKWEFGGGVGGGFYTSQTVKNERAGNATAKFEPGLAAGAWLSNNIGNRWGGEIRYDYQRSGMQLSGNGGSASFAAISNAIHYNFQYHFADREAKVRPFVSFGAGFKVYHGTGTEVAVQPLSRIALLTRTNDARPMAVFGGGVKAKLGERFGIRVAVYDFLTPFPSKAIAPNTGSSVGGWIHDFVPMFGISYLF